MPAFCSAGEAECLTGWPYTAQYRVLAFMEAENGSVTRAVIGKARLKEKPKGNRQNHGKAESCLRKLHLFQITWWLVSKAGNATARNHFRLNPGRWVGRASSKSWYPAIS